jgi:hypothetical protein
METKTCSSCKQEKAVALFYNYSKSKDGKFNQCKTCQKESVRKYKNKMGKAYYERERYYKWKSYYGLSEEEYKNILDGQGGSCAICGENIHLEENNGKRSAIDHCHNSGEVRGILCSNCNRGIGFLGDNSKVVKKALDYLLKFENKKEDKYGED